jgi:hypothetical protein
MSAPPRRPATRILDALGAEAHGVLEHAAHGATELHSTLELLRDVLRAR